MLAIMRKISPFLFGLSLLLVAVPVSAAVFHSGEEFTLSQGSTISDDLYAAGSSITTAGEVRGDIFAAGGKVLVNGNVAEDIVAAGGSIDVLSNVGGDVRVAGGQVIIGGRVGSDVLAAGGQVQVLSEVFVGGDVVIVGGRVVIDGTVAGDVRVYGDDVRINGTINGDLEVFADNAFALGDTATVSGDLSYRSPNELTLRDGAVAGEVRFEEHNVRFDRSLINAVMGAAFTLKLLMLLVAGLLLVAFFNPFMHELNTYTVPNFGKSLVVGFVVFIVVPALSLLLLLSIIGALVAGVLLLAYLLLLIAAKVYTGILTGALISKWAHKEVTTDWRYAALGIVIIQLVSLVPVIGWAVSFIIMLAALGALSYFGYQHFWVAR
jgi:hypothetical protein